MKRITSRDNPHFKVLKKLCQSGRERRKSGRILLDGIHLIESYVQCVGIPEEIVVSESGACHHEIAGALKKFESTGAVTLLSDGLFADLATVETPSGIMAVVPQPLCARGLNQTADAVLLDGVQDPGNLGSILRSSAAAGFSQILLSVDCAHAWSPKTLRAAMGANFLLEIHESCDLFAFLGGYRGQAIVTALDDAKDIFTLDLKAPIAWIFGSEGQGVRPELTAFAGQRVRIPMPGMVESLNVAAAAAICLFETVRQRRACAAKP